MPKKSKTSDSTPTPVLNSDVAEAYVSPCDEVTIAVSNKWAKQTKHFNEDETNVSSRFILKERIGEGGHGEIWSGIQKTLGRLVAIKLLKGSLDSSSPHNQQGTIERLFHQEALLSLIHI